MQVGLGPKRIDTVETFSIFPKIQIALVYNINK